MPSAGRLHKGDANLFPLLLFLLVPSRPFKNRPTLPPPPPPPPNDPSPPPHLSNSPRAASILSPSICTLGFLRERMSEYIWTLDGASQIIHLTTGQTARDAHRSTLCYIVEFCRRRSPLPPPSLPPTFSRPPHYSLARWGFSRLKPPSPPFCCL